MLKLFCLIIFLFQGTHRRVSMGISCDVLTKVFRYTTGIWLVGFFVSMMKPTQIPSDALFCLHQVPLSSCHRPISLVTLIPSFLCMQQVSETSNWLVYTQSIQ